jgi:formylglycine-generating enzyme required for sulfatase activity
VGAAQRAAAGVEATEAVTSTIDRGNQLLDVATQERNFDTAKAERQARQAAQCFLAVLPSRPPELLFVPPRETNEDGFYIDARPVSPVQFATFAADGAWRPIGPAPSAPGEAFTNVTYYDAAAYAAFSDARLPTLEEWKRAFDVHGEDMAGSVYEWTSTVANADRKPTFGDQLTICRAYKDANDETALDTSGALEFDGYDEMVGFRCVHDIRTDPQSIERLLP